jgi:hypothetical protein
MLFISRKDNLQQKPTKDVLSAVLLQSQDALRSIYQVYDVLCPCVGGEGIRMHVKHRESTSEVNEKYWLADNPGAPEHDIECPLFAHKSESDGSQEQLDNPYRITESVEFRTPREQQKDSSQIPSVNTPYRNSSSSYLQALSRRLFYNAFDASLANYYFGQASYNADAVAVKIKKSDFAQQLDVNGEKLAQTVTYGRRGLAMLRRDLKAKPQSIRIWVSMADEVTVTKDAISIDGQWYPSQNQIERKQANGPYLVVCYWMNDKYDKAYIKELECIMVASDTMCLPVSDSKEREMLVEAGKRILNERSDENRLFLMRGLLPEHNQAVIGMKKSGVRQRMNIEEWLAQ